MDYTLIVLDEIALEGLDGITIDALWLRLSERSDFLLATDVVNDKDVQLFLWNLIRRLRHVEFYVLPNPRKPLTIRNFCTVDPELGIIMQLNDINDSVLDDLYPHKLINDKGIVGSCSTYDTRKKISGVVRKLELSSVYDLYRDTLVIVANQNARHNSLIGLNKNPNLEISPIQFCILERIGRSRYRGELTQGKSGLAMLGEDAKTIFYLRKYLLKYNLITKQVYQQKTGSSSFGLLLHLPRFYKFIKQKYMALIERVMNILADQPNHLIEYDVLRKKMSGVLKKLTKVGEFQKYFRSDARVPYRALYPDADAKQWKTKLGDKEKMIRIVELRDPDANIQDLKNRLLSNDDDDDYEKDEQGMLDVKRYIDVSLLTQCYMLLKGKGVKGLSQSGIARELGISKLQARTVTRNLMKIGAFAMYMDDVGRQRITMFCLKTATTETTTNENDKSLLLDCSIVEDGRITYNLSKSSFTEKKHSEMEDSLMDEILSPDSKVGVPKREDIKSVESSSETVKTRTTRKRKKISTDISSSATSRKKKKLENDCIDKQVKHLDAILDEKLNESKISVDNVEMTCNDVKLDENMDVEMKVEDNAMDVEVCNESQDMKCKELSEEIDMNGIKTSNDVGESNKDILNIEVNISEELNWLIPKPSNKERLKVDDQSLKTVRLLKRSNLVLEAVHRLKVITDIRRLVILINHSEMNEGLSARMDKKSLMRILYKLAMNNHIKVYRVVLKHQLKVIELSFVCSTNVTSDDPVIRSSIEFNKMKFFPLNKVTPTCEPAVKRPSITFEKRNIFSHYPKFNRMKIMHRFLFYLVYGYDGRDDLEQTAIKLKVTKDQGLTDEDLDAFPQLYQPRIDEHMFVAPLPQYNELEEGSGWFLMADILTRMPLNVFIQLVQIPYFIPELDIFMSHPIKKYYLLGNLPSKIRNCITATRKYIFTLYDILSKLVYIGLLQFGAHHNKEKDKLFAYVNRNSSIWDTTMSRPGYNRISADLEYPVQKYRFDSIDVVDEYWHNCWKICMNTRLGGRAHVMGTDVILENLHYKQEMIDALKPRHFNEAGACDLGNVPGDKLGAAGFDSAMFAHLKRNWVCKKLNQSFEGKKTLQMHKVHLTSKSVNVTRPAKRKVAHSVKVKNSSEGETHPGKTKNKPAAKEKASNLYMIPQNKSHKTRKPTVTIRRINPVKKSLHRKPFYDQVDREALKRMSKLRVDWSREEDRVLLICKVASAFICPETRKQVNANMFQAYREVLHRTLHSSKNKTSRACQRRIAYMLRSASMCHNVHLWIEELKQDESIMKKYGDTLEIIEKEAKQKGKRIVELESIWRERFKGLVNDLMNRYNTNNSLTNFSFCYILDNKVNSTFLLPDSLVEFHEKYDLQCIEKKPFNPKDKYDPVLKVSDIYSAVINATIHSTLSCNSDKTSWSYHLFSIYQQYPERVLRQSLNRLRENHMVSYKKSYQVRNKTGNNYYLPLSASPYQLSFGYANLIQTKYQLNTFIECFKTFSELFESNDGIVVNKSFIELFSHTGGSTAAIIELYSSNIVSFNIEIPNQVIILDPHVKDKDETYSRLVQRYKDVLSNYKKNLTSSVLFQKHNYMSLLNRDCEDDCDDDELEKAEEDMRLVEKSGVKGSCDNTRVVQNVAKAASRIALYLMNDNENNPDGLVPKEMDHVYDFFVVNSCKLFVNIVDPKIFSTQQTDAICNIIDDNVVKNTLQSIRDSAVFNNIDISGIDSELETKEEEEEYNGYKVKEYDDVLIEKIINRNFNEDEVCRVKEMLALIKRKGDMGVTNGELINVFGNSFETLNLVGKLVDLSFVLKTGAVFARFVHYMHVEPWLLHSYRNLRYDREARDPLPNVKDLKVKEVTSVTREDDECSDIVEPDSCNSTAANVEEKNNMELNLNDKIDKSRWCLANEDLNKLTNNKVSEPVRVIMRPWLRIDSTLNRRILDTMLSSVLGHVMLNPGISLSNLQGRFTPAFQPYHVSELCDILLKLNCIVRYCVRIKNKPTLFSNPCEVFVEKSTGLECEDTIRFEADRFAITNLGKFLEKRPYTKDYIDCLISK